MGALYQVDGMPREFYKHNTAFPRLVDLNLGKISQINLNKSNSKYKRNAFCLDHRGIIDVKCSLDKSEANTDGHEGCSH